MMLPADSTDGIDWSLTTWEGARREQLRRWAELPLERIILALEEMQELAEKLAAAKPAEHSGSQARSSGMIHCGIGARGFEAARRRRQSS
jgi:hypothetical protein